MRYKILGIHGSVQNCPIIGLEQLPHRRNIFRLCEYIFSKLQLDDNFTVDCSRFTQSYCLVRNLSAAGGATVSNKEALRNTFPAAIGDLVYTGL